MLVAVAEARVRAYARGVEMDGVGNVDMVQDVEKSWLIWDAVRGRFVSLEQSKGIVVIRASVVIYEFRAKHWHRVIRQADHAHFGAHVALNYWYHPPDDPSGSFERPYGAQGFWEREWRRGAAQRERAKKPRGGGTGSNGSGRAG